MKIIIRTLSLILRQTIIITLRESPLYPIMDTFIHNYILYYTFPMHRYRIINKKIKIKQSQVDDKLLEALQINFCCDLYFIK